jgi:hypothetical protein
MSSTALDDWSGLRAERLDELVAMHEKATGTAPGRRYGTTEFNRTLVTALVAQFQGFARDLHDLAVDEFVRTIQPAARQDVVRLVLKQGRMLDSRTPRRDHLGSDFGRLGIELVPAVKSADARSETRLDALDALVDLRNAIGHGNEAQLSKLAAQGFIATLPAFRRYRSTFNGLARTLDSVLATQLASLLATDPPW